MRGDTPASGREHPAGEGVLECDGASRGNPGSASIGYVLYDAEGHEIEACGAYLGEGVTNNVAEYEALRQGLEAAQRRRIRRLRVRMDSELVVRQMRGEYKVRNERLRPLHARCGALAAGFERFAIEHVPRERNRRADALANRALDDLAAPPEST